MREQRECEDPPVIPMMRLQRDASDRHDDMRRSAGDCHAMLHCSLHDAARGPGEKSPSIENKRASDGDEEDSEDSFLYRHRQRTNSAFLLKISLHTCSPRHSAAGLMLIDFHCGHDWAKIRFPGEINHKYSASPPTISNWTAGTYFYKWRK